MSEEEKEIERVSQILSPDVRRITQYSLESQVLESLRSQKVLHLRIVQRKVSRVLVQQARGDARSCIILLQALSTVGNLKSA